MSERMRYESETWRTPTMSRDRGGGGGSSSSSSSSTGDTPWVGAFERVFGAHGREEEGQTEREWRAARSTTTPSTLRSGSGAVRIIAKDSCGEAVGESSATSSAPSSQSDNVYGTSPVSASAPRVQCSRSGSNEASLKLPPKLTLPMPPSATTGAYSLAPPGPPPLLRGDELVKRMQCTSSGPSLITVSETSMVLEEVYVNHAPSLQTFTLINKSDSIRCLVRLESDLGRGISFLKRRRTAQLHVKHSIYFPANTVAWARADGLSASHLRDLRHFVANLEPADSFILEPGVELAIFLSFRPIHFVSDTTGERTLLPPRSPTLIEYASSASPPQLLHGREGSLASRSSSQSSAITSPAVTTTTILTTSLTAQPQLPRTPQPPPAELPLFSPRSAPELSHRGIVVPPIVHRAFEVRGTITLRASPLAPAASDSGTTTDEPPHVMHISSGASNLSSTSASSSSRPASYYSSQVSSGVVSTASAATTEHSQDESQTIALPFYAHSCRPQLALELEHGPGEAEASLHRPAHVHGLITLDLGDTFVNQLEERDIVLRNQSEIECLWQARIDDAEADATWPHLTLLEGDSGVPVEVLRAGEEVQYRPQTIAPRSTHRMRLSLQAKQAGREFEQLITFTNMHNASNSIRVLVRANILLHATDEALAVLSGDVVDFGDCCGGHWARQLLVLRNMSEAALDVALSVQKGVEATFQLAELAPQPEEMPDDTPLPTPAMGITPSVLGSTASSVFTESEAGGTTSSMSGAGSGAGSSNAGPPPPPAAVTTHFLSSSSETGRSETDLPLSAEQARTPTSHARPPPSSEPPFFELPRSDASAAQAPRPQLPRKDTATSEVTEGTEDDMDASSIASQAGSAPGSPVRTRPPWSLRSNVVEASPARVASQLSSYGPPLAALGAATAEVYSEGDQASMASVLRNRPSTSLFARPASSAATRSALRGAEEWSVTDDAVSMRSDATALSQDSRLGPFAASVASHSGSASGMNRLIHSGAGATLVGLKTPDQVSSGQLRELVLKPGVEYRLVVAYKPKRGEPDEEFTAGRLVEDIFRISLDYARVDCSPAAAKVKVGRQRKTVLCRTRTCTSFITVLPKVVDLGESNVGARKSAHVTVENRSELTARIDVRFVSKVLSMYTGEVAIPARQTVELRVDFFPRRVNETYRKQITVANLMNRNDDQILEVRSKNVDKQRVSLHSLFYRILTPSGANFIDFGDVNINSTRVRTFSIENISDAKIALELSAAHPEDLKLYVKAPARPLPSPTLSATSGAGNGELFPATPAPSKAAHAVRTPSRYAELEASDAPPASVEPESAAGDRHKSPAKPMMSGVDLKERFLETISVDSPASIRRENATWRLAQKHSHFRAVPDGKSKGKSNGSSSKKDPSAPPKVKPPINLVSALKKGGKGRITVQWGKSMTFKDRKILSEFEALDLATGPPVDAKRIPLKSKRYQTLETLEMGHKLKGSTGASSSGKTSSKSSRAPAEASTDGTTAAETQSTSGHVASASGASNAGSIGPKAGKKVRASAVSRKLPSMLAADIHSKAGSRASTSSSRVAREGSTASTSESCRSPALTGKRKAQCLLSDAVNVSKLSTDEFITAIEAQNPSLSAFFLGSKELEEKLVRTEINLQRELQSAISNGRLVPVDTLDLDPKQERQVVAVYTPNGSTRPHIQGNARKQDSRIFMRLLEYDKTLVRASSTEQGSSAVLDGEHDDYELPVRDLMVRATVCRSLLELGQPHINFGHMEKGQSKTRKITIQNRSEWVLRYCIRKSGSIASGDIKIAAGLYGLVPGHGKREIEFIFSPSLSGPFQEKLVVENVADRDRDGTLSLKATVRKVPNFAVEPVAIDFGTCLPGKLTAAEGFVVTNTTAKPRTFVVAVESEDLRHQRSIVDVILAAAADKGGVRGTLSKAEEEELEHISQKLKIAIRKGHEDKVKKYESRLAELGVAPAVSVEGEENAVAESEALPPTPATGEPTRLKRVASTVTIGLAAGQSKRLLIRLRPHAVHTVLGAEHTAAEAAAAAALSTPSAVAEAEDVGVRVQIHEVKNRDEMKTVEVRARVELPTPRLCATTEECERVADPLPLDDHIVFSSTSPQ